MSHPDDEVIDILDLDQIETTLMDTVFARMQKQCDERIARAFGVPWHRIFPEKVIEHIPWRRDLIQLPRVTTKEER